MTDQPRADRYATRSGRMCWIPRFNPRATSPLLVHDARDSRFVRPGRREGMTVAAVGGAIGVAGALAISRVMASLLFGVKATDPLTFAAVAAALGAVALTACYIPARRATKADPLRALRAD